MSIKIRDIRNIFYSRNKTMRIITFELHSVTVPPWINLFFPSCKIWNINVISFEELNHDLHFILKEIILILIIFSLIGTLLYSFLVSLLLEIPSFITRVRTFIVRVGLCIFLLHF